ncbi:hypothetical protein FDECE_15536 [Fusarium decemcellulare]|nr:hypothetical protein FDECE_15536 [Fusarium decemcellulare]
MDAPPFPSFTKVWHNKSYPAISPSRPELSAKGKTIVITGGGSGIGAGITEAFAGAGSTQIAIMGRTEKRLLSTKHAVETVFPGIEVLVIVADITRIEQVDEGLNKINQRFGKIDVFVSNAAFLPVPEPVLSPDFDIQDWWTAFRTNVLGVVHSVRGFANHAAEEACFLNISTCISHIPPLEAGVSAYAASKAAANKLLDYIALENPGLRVMNVHPGLVESDMSRKSGHGGLDHVELPGHFCVWLRSPEADFLRGKFVWVNWDVDELKARREEIMSTDLLDTKLGGVSFEGPGNTSRTAAENTCRVQFLEGKLVTNAFEPRGRPCTYPGRLSCNSDLGGLPVAGSGLSQDGPSNNDSLLDAENPTLSLNNLEPYVAAHIDTFSGDSQLPTSPLTWDNAELTSGFLGVLDILTPFSADYHPDADIETAHSSSEAQRPVDTNTVSRRSPEPLTWILGSLPYQDPSSILERRKFSRPELQLTGDLALHTLRSYLYVMADRDCIPPFIHPKYGDLMELGTNRPSPLYAAIKLAKMLFLGRGMNKTLIWSLIRMEQERLLNDHPKFDKWEILEALQSLILYVLMRITEGRHGYTNFDTQLLISVHTVCSHLTKRFGMLVSSDELEDRTIPWKDWVFFESRRRCSTAFLIIDKILYTRVSDPGSVMTEFTFVPAPSPATLWGAENEVDWAASYRRYLRENATHGMVRNGDLVALKGSAGDQHDRWYAYADSFGLLVTLAADLMF